MAIKVKIPKGRSRSGGATHFSLSDPLVRAGLAVFIVVSVIGLSVFAYFYVHYQHVIDQRMAGPVFANAAKIYATPRTIFPGYAMTSQELVSELRHAGYAESSEGGDIRLGTYKQVKGGVEVRPGPDSFHSPEGALVKFDGGAVSGIASLDKGQALGGYELEPLLVTGLFDDKQRSKRRLITFDELPKHMVDAVLAIEDRRFFQHNGINYWRFFQAAIINLQRGRNAQGASTLTMQISRGFFLTPEKKITRKLAEMMIAVELEQRYSKQQIFEFYANQVNLGQRGSFSIDGFGEAAQAYFGKDVKDLSVPEAALIAGMIQRPNYFSPYRHPDRAMARRNIVLDGMVEIGALTSEEAEKAKATSLKLAPPNVEASDAPYFVDLVKESLQGQYTEDQLNEDGLRIYTSLDPELQRAAAESITAGIKEVDSIIAKRRTKRVKGANGKYETKVEEGQLAQVALIAMDPSDGRVLALVGGRNYGFSQLNHAVAKRPTGSIFKPFVYAAAVNTALTNQEPVITPVTLVDNSPSTFLFDDKVYEPHNYEDKYNEIVTARFALAHSLNNATVKIAEQIGYDKVADLAQAAGIKSVKATPAMALGSYDATPLEMSAAYTVFANHGVRVAPVMVRSIRNAQGEVVQDFKPEVKPVMDPRVVFVMTNMMEAVLDSGTAVGVRARGFNAPAAGKTGTSHDAWFAGYTSNLLCIVWVGLDDYTDLKIEGAHSAAPIWAEFMKRAVALPAYRDVRPFVPPEGVVKLSLDKVTNRVATPSCPDDYDASFIEGTQPTGTCDQNPDHQNFFTRIFTGTKPPLVIVSNAQKEGLPPPDPASANQTSEVVEKPADPKKKKGFFGKLFGVFKDEKKDEKKRAEGDAAVSKAGKPGEAPPADPRPHLSQ